MEKRRNIYRRRLPYTFTGKKGSVLIANTTNEEYGITKWDRFTALSDEYFYNGETHIKTSIGDIPCVHFYDGIDTAAHKDLSRMKDRYQNTNLGKMTKTTLAAMRKWLRDLDRANVKRDRGGIAELYEQERQNPSWVWTDTPEDMQEDYEGFKLRADSILEN